MKKLLTVLMLLSVLLALATPVMAANPAKWVLNGTCAGAVFEVYNHDVAVGEVPLDGPSIYGYIWPNETLVLRYWNEQLGWIDIGTLANVNASSDVNIAVGTSQFAAKYTWEVNPEVPAWFCPGK